MMQHGRLKELLADALRTCWAAGPSGGHVGLPAGAHLVWRWFNDLCRTRTSGGYGPNPISYIEIEAYARLHGWPLRPRDIDLILYMDRLWLDQARASRGEGAASAGPAAKLTPAIFDAVFG